MKTIVSCPSCQKKLRIPNDKIIRFNCSNCRTSIFAKNGKITNDPVRIEINPNKNYNTKYRAARRKAVFLWGNKFVKLGVASLLFLIIALLCYSFSQRERRAFEKVQEEITFSSVSNFLKEYPRGMFRKKAIYLQDSIMYIKANTAYQESCKKSICRCEALLRLMNKKTEYNPKLISNSYEKCLLQNASQSNSFVSLDLYRAAFPEGQYLDSISILDNNLWTTVEQQYLARKTKAKVSEKARLFVQGLLEHSKVNKEDHIYVKFNSHLALEDWEDYSKEAQDLTDSLYAKQNRMLGNSYPIPSASPAPSIKSMLKTNNVDLQHLIVKALQTRLDSILTPNPFKIKHIVKNGSEVSTPATITIDYRIKTLSLELGNIKFPSLYIYSQEAGFSNSRLKPEEVAGLLGTDINDLRVKQFIKQQGGGVHGNFLDYLLATDIHWVANFEVPNSEVKFSFITSSRPNSTFSNVKGKQNAYRLMMESTFQNYALQVAEGVGL